MAGSGAVATLRRVQGQMQGLEALQWQDQQPLQGLEALQWQGQEPLQGVKALQGR